ncbi:Na+/H+ antiporter NhaA [Heliorestis acidaminivorans]|uniref:Na(+)/H(+) antiporter NhaA n=1 Tax=Heliorestis acidaminivorans TaxID=553427 RepID=A0A6I0ET72_9FIRM|nr:Na+/H+ antiporter NhaA [Heliorestis acidaminivorans]KAB2953249.1 Na+/H+ antiporter NhaA [Heliorestis acidaminivorans]
MRPFQQFFQLQASGGILLLLCTVIALTWANSPLGESYQMVWQIPFTIGIGEFVLTKPLVLWINDGLMAIFFFVVGLEIKREVLHGELKSPRQSAFPIAAAIGGMVVPAGIYAALNWGTEGITGWGIPMATDIAFALGILALLGKRVPLALKIFLAALAIVDDLGAVLVIALFYTADISGMALAVAFGFLAVLALANFIGVRHPLIYILLGIGLWFAFLKSGVHATIGGVLLAMTIPASSKINAEEFMNRTRKLIKDFENAGNGRKGEVNMTENHQVCVQALESNCESVDSPLHRMEHSLHPYVSYFVMPVFALANAGVVFEGGLVDSLTHPVSLGIILGLVLGKQIGVTLFSYIAVKMGWASLPKGVTWTHVYGVSMLAGVGFTMSLFIGGLAFEDHGLLTLSKVGILFASLISGLGGYFTLRYMAKRDASKATATS